jgi:hypothetical protein
MAEQIGRRSFEPWNFCQSLGGMKISYLRENLSAGFAKRVQREISLVPFSKLLERPSVRITSTTDLDRLQHTTSPQLRQNLFRVELPGVLRLVRLDASDVMDIGVVDRIHQICKRVLEDGTERRFPG